MMARHAASTESSGNGRLSLLLLAPCCPHARTLLHPQLAIGDIGKLGRPLDYDPGCVKTLRGITAPGILGPMVMRRAKSLQFYKSRQPWTAYVAHGHRLERLGFAADHRPHSSSASRFTAGASGFLLLIQSGERPDLYRESFRFETIPSRPSLQA